MRGIRCMPRLLWELHRVMYDKTSLGLSLIRLKHSAYRQDEGRYFSFICLVEEFGVPPLAAIQEELLPLPH